MLRDSAISVNVRRILFLILNIPLCFGLFTLMSSLAYLLFSVDLSLWLFIPWIVFIGVCLLIDFLVLKLIKIATREMILISLAEIFVVYLIIWLIVESAY